MWVEGECEGEGEGECEGEGKGGDTKARVGVKARAKGMRTRGASCRVPMLTRSRGTRPRAMNS